LLKAGAHLPSALVYDNACALRLHWNKVYNTKYLKKNEMTDKRYNLLLALDRFHQKGHVRPMCRKMMNPDDNQHGGIFKNVNTSVCDQFFFSFNKILIFFNPLRTGGPFLVHLFFSKENICSTLNGYNL
jgi:hypothetical protein